MAAVIPLPLRNDAANAAEFIRRYSEDNDYRDWFNRTHGEFPYEGGVPLNIINASWANPRNRHVCIGQRLGAPINSRNNAIDKRPGASCCALTRDGMFGTNIRTRINPNGEDCGYAFSGGPVVSAIPSEVNRTAPLTPVEKGLISNYVEETIQGVVLISGRAFVELPIDRKIRYIFDTLGSFDSLATHCGTIDSFLTDTATRDPALARLYASQLYVRIRSGLRSIQRTEKLKAYLDRLCMSVTKEPVDPNDKIETGGRMFRRTRRKNGRRRTQKKRKTYV